MIILPHKKLSGWKDYTVIPTPLLSPTEFGFLRTLDVFVYLLFLNKDILIVIYVAIRI